MSDVTPFTIHVTDEELAAIMAAYEAVRPRPAAAPAALALPIWRFSGRWWRDSAAARPPWAK